MTWKNLKKLNLSGNNITCGGAIAIGQNETWDQLEELVLSHNKIGNPFNVSERIFAFKYLRALNLSANQLEDKEAIDIRRNVTWA